MRDMLTFARMLQPDLAEAMAVVTAALPTDDYSATLTFIGGASGALKLGTRISSQYDFSVPANTFLLDVGPTGLSKTEIRRRLVERPARKINDDYNAEYALQLSAHAARCKGKPKGEHPKEPLPTFPHLMDYSPEALALWLAEYEKRGAGVYIHRDEVQAIFQAVDSDKKSGRGTSEALLLETFDGSGLTTIRVGTKGGEARTYGSCHVSLGGGIQPKKLKALINANGGEDTTGKFARFLYVQHPIQALELRDDDFSPEEKKAHDLANAMLARYVEWLHDMEPRTYRLELEARKKFHRWFNAHQQEALRPSTPAVIAAMLGKTSAHALRLACVLHLLRTVDERMRSPETVPVETMEIAMALVDVATSEARRLHVGAADAATEMMERVQAWSLETGEPRLVTWQIAKKEVCTTKALRKLKAGDFYQGILNWQELGYGVISEDGLTYTAKRSR